MSHANEHVQCQFIEADVAELADALDLGSSVPDVQVQVLSSAVQQGGKLNAFHIFLLEI